MADPHEVDSHPHPHPHPNLARPSAPGAGAGAGAGSAERGAVRLVDPLVDLLDTAVAVDDRDSVVGHVLGEVPIKDREGALNLVLLVQLRSLAARRPTFGGKL